MAESKFYPPTDELPFLIKAIPSSHHCDFECYECMGWTQGQDGEYTVPDYPRKGATNSGDTVEDYEESEPYLSGSIKWDGCANLRFDEQDRVMLHFCGRSDAAKVGALMNRLYDLAGELIPTWDARLGQ